MAKYKLTITDLETGKVEVERECDGATGVVTLRGSIYQTSFSFGDNLSAVDRLNMLLLLDDIKTDLLSDPVVAVYYANKEKIVKERIICDISALEKQAGEL